VFVEELTRAPSGKTPFVLNLIPSGAT